MYRIIDDRCTGKTTRLICLAKRYNAILVSACPQCVIEKCKELGFKEPVEVVDYKGFLSSRYLKKERKFLIDDMNGFLHTLCSGIIGYTDNIEYNINGKLATIVKE